MITTALKRPAMMLDSRASAIAVLLALLPLAGCESFGRGVTQAVLEGSDGDTQDTRNCEVEGRPFTGIEPYLAKQDKLPPYGETVGDRPEVKVLYVHGIGTHVPGDGTTLRQTLAKSLGLDIRAPRPKRIVIASPSFPNQNLGEINVTRLTDGERRRDLLFYELTWSPITQPDKDLIAFDKEQDYVLRRAALNQAMRTFVNDVAPDPLAYAGQKREPILVAVTQSICWVVSRSWSELPELTEGQYCGADLPGVGSRVAVDDFVIVSHSLGSRAVIDAMQRLTNLPVSADPQAQAHRGRLPQPRHPGVHAVQPAAAARGRARGPAGHRRDRRLLRPQPGQARAVLRQDRADRLFRPQRPDELPGAGQVRRPLHRIAPVPERHQRHHQRGRA